MRCRPEATKSQRCAVGKQLVMRCRFAHTTLPASAPGPGNGGPQMKCPIRRSPGGLPRVGLLPQATEAIKYDLPGILLGARRPATSRMSRRGTSMRVRFQPLHEGVDLRRVLRAD